MWGCGEEEKREKKWWWRRWVVRVPMYVDSLSGAELRGGTRMRGGDWNKSRHVSRQNMTVASGER